MKIENRALFIKKKKWEYEKEIRACVVIPLPDPWDPINSYPKLIDSTGQRIDPRRTTGRLYYEVPFSPTLITEICVGPKADEETINKIILLRQNNQLSRSAKIFKITKNYIKKEINN